MVSFGVPVVAVVISGRATVLPACIERCAAVLFSFHPGSEGGHGLADVLTGRQEPGGRLPITLPLHAGQIPIYHDHKPTGRPMDEYHRLPGQPSSQHGQRLLDCVGAPRYRFGYGLTYTTFALSEPTVTKSCSAVNVQVDVQNTGKRAGSTVVEVYLRDPVAETSQPVRRLVGHARVTLAAGTNETVTIAVPKKAFGLHPSRWFSLG